MKHRATSIALTGVLGLGGLAAGVVVAPAIAMAQTTDTSTADAVSDRVSRITEALSSLVGNGTITQDQADQVAITLAEELPGRGGPGHGHGPGGGGRNLGTAAEALGVTEDELRTALEGGQSLADVAEAQGVETQTLIDALVAEADERIDAKLAEGDITQEQADEKKAAVVERVTTQVERQGLPTRGERGERGPRPSADNGSTTTPQAEGEADGTPDGT